MHKLMIPLACGIGFMATAALADDTFATTQASQPQQALTDAIAKVCALPKLPAAVLVACNGHNYPALVRDGSRFANRGVGAQFNALIAIQ